MESNKYSIKNYSVMVQWSPESNRYVARCRELNGCGSESEDPVEAVKFTFDALEDMLDYAWKNKIALPDSHGIDIVNVPSVQVPEWNPTEAPEGYTITTDGTGPCKHVVVGADGTVALCDED